MSSIKSYIDASIIEGFKNKSDGFDYDKLVELFVELNSVYLQDFQYSSSMLVRAILDHIPPLLGFTSFNEVVSNYSWPETEKKFMEKLLDFKNEGDSALHKVISNKPDHLTIDDLPPGNRINTLLQECLTNGLAFDLSKSKLNQPKQIKTPKLQVKIINNKVSWANYGIAGSPYPWSSFRVDIEIDNFNSNNPDFVSALLEATDNDGIWTANNFLFESTKEQRWKPNEPFPVQAKDVKQIGVFISDTEFGSQGQRHMPDIDMDTLNLIITTRSGQILTIPIKAGWITKG